MEKLVVSPSPHIRSNITTSKVMSHVMLSLIPAIAAATVIFGGRALMLIGFCIAVAVVLERLCGIVMKRPDTTGDLSAAVTGLIFALNLPPTLSFWIAFIGVFFAIVITKQLFGGLGCNFANPALVGRIVIMLSFPSAMTTWAEPFTADVTTFATPLASKSANMLDMFFGMTSGCLGETCSIALIIGGIYLCIVRVITPSAPLAFVGTVALFSFIVGENPLYQVLSGGLLLGSIFMATDYVTTPITQTGKIIFGIGCGIITCVIRFYGSTPEGASYAILLMNIVTPYINMLCRIRPVGAKKPVKQLQEGK